MPGDKNCDPEYRNLINQYIDDSIAELDSLLGGILHGLERTGFPDPRLDKLLFVSHSFKGSGATYGFPLVSESFAEIYQTLKQLESSGQCLEQEQKERFADLIARCRDILAGGRL